MDSWEENKGTLENLDDQVRKLMRASRDRFFTEYLQKMSERVRQQKYQTDLLQAELDRSYQMYLYRMKVAGIPVEEVVQSEEDAKSEEKPIEILQSKEVLQPEGIQRQEVLQHSEEIQQAEGMQQQEALQHSEEIQQAEGVQQQEVLQNSGEIQQFEGVQNQEEVQPSGEIQQVQEIRQQEELQRPGEIQQSEELHRTGEVRQSVEEKSSTESPQYINLMDGASGQETYSGGAPGKEITSGGSPTQNNSKRTGEFTIGAAVLSIIGGAFVLAALVTLGMTYMGDIVKGICLYGISLLFLLVSELFLYRRWPKLGCTISAIGIGGLYLSTGINYLGLGVFNQWIAMGIVLAITILVVALSRKRDSVTYRIIGLIAAYSCFLMIRAGITDTEFLVISGMIMFLNILCTSFPVRKHGTAINITHMLINTFFSTCFMFRAMVGYELGQLPVLIFMISSMIVQQILLIIQFSRNRKEMLLAEQTGQNVEINKGIVTAYYISTVFYAIWTTLLVYGLVDINSSNWYAYGSAIAVGVIGLAAIAALSILKCSGQWHVYSFLNVMIFCIIECSVGDWDMVVCMVAMLVIAKLLSRKEILTFKINDVIVTALVCFSVIIYDSPYVYLLLGGIVLSILLISHWQTYYEIILTTTLTLYIAYQLPTLLQLPVAVGILLISILLFNNVARWRGKYILVFNGLALGGQIICFLWLSHPIYQNEYITYLCMLVFGVATIVLTLQERYQMNFSGKYLVLAVFLTYMAFIFRTTLPVINSILLMVIALVCVAIGFIVRNKPVRIYGLVLSLVVCGKLVLYDFFDAPTLQKTILFFVVGVIALIIAAIYMILEKKNNIQK